MKYIIKDWAGNILSFDGIFKSKQLSAPMEFNSFEDGWDWVYENIQDEECYQDLYVEEKIK